MVVNASRGLSAIKLWGIWTLGFLSFPLAGLAGMAIAGPVTTPLAAAVGGAITGLVIGAGQWLASARRLRAVRWVSATMIGMGVGLTLGAAVVEYGTSIAELALMGALTGVPLGIAQAFALPSGARHRWAWAATIPALWALGWTVTYLFGIDVGRRYTVFGATGAIVVSALAGLLLQVLLSHPVNRAGTSRLQPEPTPIEAT